MTTSVDCLTFYRDATKFSVNVSVTVCMKIFMLAKFCGIFHHYWHLAALAGVNTARALVLSSNYERRPSAMSPLNAIAFNQLTIHAASAPVLIALILSDLI